MFLKWCIAKLVEMIVVSFPVVLGKVSVARKDERQSVDFLEKYCCFAEHFRTFVYLGKQC